MQIKCKEVDLPGAIKVSVHLFESLLPFIGMKATVFMLLPALLLFPMFMFAMLLLLLLLLLENNVIIYQLVMLSLSITDLLLLLLLLLMLFTTLAANDTAPMEKFRKVNADIPLLEGHFLFFFFFFFSGGLS